MGNSCILYPTVKVGNQEVESKLFKDLLKLTGNRETAKYIWGLSQVPEFTNLLEGLVRDENGEPTISSLNRAMNIKALLNGNVSLIVEKQDLGVIDKEGNTITYDNSEDIINKVIDYNKNNNDLVANINKISSGYVISLERKTIENAEIPSKLIFQNALNNQLVGIMRRLGFDVKVDGSLIYDGIFDPTNAEYTAEGLKTVIRIAEGKLGEDAFPEEFSHMIIAGLLKEPLVFRLLNTLDIDTIREVLGDSFDAYYDKYKGDIELLKQEAAAKLLQDYLINPVKKESLLSRLWNWVKRKLSIISEKDVDDSIMRAKQLALELSTQILDESIIDEIDTASIINSSTLYKIGSEVNKLQEMAEEALKTSSKRLKIIQSRSKRKRYKDTDLASIKNLQNLIDKKKYAKSCLAFLNDSLAQIEYLQADLNRLIKRGSLDTSDLRKIKNIAFVLRNIKEFSEGYKPIITQMTTIKQMQELGEVDLSEEDAAELNKKSLEILGIINSIDSNYKDLRFKLVYNFLKAYWKKDPEIDLGKGKTEALTLDQLLEMANKDINGIDRWISSLSSASDPLLSLIDNVVKVTKARRDKIIEDITIELRAAHEKLVSAGFNTEFMYERDSKGNLTGRIISDYDFERFNKERTAYIEKLKKEGTPYYIMKSKVESWERKHTEEVLTNQDLERIERLPIYKKDTLKNLTPEQKEYYDTMIKSKTILDNLLPDRYTNLYNAIQIRNDLVMTLSKEGNPKNIAKAVISNIKDNFVRRSDDTEFGGEYKNLLLDFSGKPVDRLPIYYTTPLEDLSRLSLDFTGSMMAYTGMAVNYNEMNKVIDILELTRDLVKDRAVQQYSGDKELKETFKIVHKIFENKFTKKGNETNISHRLDDYFDSVIYDKHKKDEGTIGNTNVDTAKAVDALKSYSSIMGIGFNVFSALSNITIGNIQIFIESMSGEYFNWKNALRAEKEYWAMLPEYLSQINDTKKTNKLALLIDKFNALESFYEDLRRQGKYQGPIARILGSTSVFILNHLGEHYLHVKNMLSMLDAKKVKLNGEIISLLDAYEIEEIKDGNKVISAKLKLKDGVTNIDGSEFTLEDEIDTTLRIKRVNQSLNGAFNEDDKGAIHRRCLGRLIMLFRQWMPEHYNRRLAGRYYDATLQQWREGYYITLCKFSLNLMKDLVRAKFELATHWNNLSPMEKANMKRAFAEIGLYVSLSILLARYEDDLDNRDSWVSRMALYNLKRTILELGASVPFVPDFIENVWTILQSPSAAIKSLNNITDLIQLQNMYVEIESGRYKGWSEYERDLVEAVPLYGKVRTAIDITEEDYMFAIFD